MLDLTEIRQLKTIFQSNGWNEKTHYHHKDLNLFDAVSEFLSQMDKREKEIALSLLSKYEIINEYFGLAKSLWNKFLAEIDPSKTYFIVPIRPRSGQKIKSGSAFLYELKSHFNEQKNKNVFFLDTPFSNQIYLNENVTVVFVDDFIGTGSQFLEIYGDFINDHGRHPEETIVIAIRVLQEGLNVMQGKGFLIIADGVREKAISSGYATGNLTPEDAKKIYDQIENKIGVPTGYQLGFGQAEAIITMKRTPDDTLPIFWITEDKQGNTWPAPFPRK